MIELTQSPRYKWIVLAVVTLGVLMVSIDTTVVVLALPAIILELHSSLVNIIWVIMSYLFVTTVLLLALGRIADIDGRVRLYNWGFILFTIGSAFCGFAGNDLQLIGARVFQGVGGALMLVNAVAIVTEVFPANQRGTALGINSMTFGLGGILGPILGGFILAITSWRWVFFINIPIGILGTFFSYHYLREVSHPRTGEKLDLVGSLAFSLCLLALLFSLMLGIQFGWFSLPVLVLDGIFLLMLVFFSYWERHTPCPALDLRLFNNRVFTFAVLAASLQSLAIFAVQFLVVFYLQGVRGDSPLHAALLLLPMPIAIAVFGPLGGRISDRIGVRIPATAGLIHAGRRRVLAHLHHHSHALSADRRRVGAHRGRRRVLRLAQYQRGDGRRAARAAGGGQCHAGDHAQRGDGGQLCAGAGRGGRQHPARPHAGHFRRHQRAPGLPAHDRLRHRHARRAARVRHHLPPRGSDVGD